MGLHSWSQVAAEKRDVYKQGDVAQFVECLHSINEVLGSESSNAKGKEGIALCLYFFLPSALNGLKRKNNRGREESRQSKENGKREDNRKRKRNGKRRGNEKRGGVR